VDAPQFLQRRPQVPISAAERPAQLAPVEARLRPEDVPRCSCKLDHGGDRPAFSPSQPQHVDRRRAEPLDDLVLVDPQVPLPARPDRDDQGLELECSIQQRIGRRGHQHHLGTGQQPRGKVTIPWPVVRVTRLQRDDHRNRGVDYRHPGTPFRTSRVQGRTLTNRMASEVSLHLAPRAEDYETTLRRTWEHCRPTRSGLSLSTCGRIPRQAVAGPIRSLRAERPCRCRHHRPTRRHRSPQVVAWVRS
jgi:hypothetical protein